MPFLIAAIVLIAVFAAFLWCIKPNLGRRSSMRPFEECYIAHRGLHDNATDAPENSLPAFKKAVENGYGIELDVQLSSDGKLVVFHDADLKRICGVDKALVDCSFEELSSYPLADSDERIPLFEDVLKVVDGRVPLVVERKKEGDCIATTRAAAELLDSYNGVYCVESFHAGAMRWFRRNRPDVIRGQLSMDYFAWKVKQPWIVKLVLSDLMLNFVSRPDFIAYDHRQAYRFSYRLLRRLFTVENVAWTVQSEEELEKAEKIFDCIIFDSFIPKADRPKGVVRR